MDNVLKSSYYESPLGYNNVGWYVNEVIKKENKKTFYFKNTKKDIIMAEKDEEDYKKFIICRFCEKEILSRNIRDHCHLTGEYSGPVH